MESIAQFLGKFRFLPGPIIAVELMAMSRRKWLFILRLLYACALLLAFLFIYDLSFGSNRPSGQNVVDRSAIAAAASAFFKTLGFVQIFVVLLIGPAATASTIASERERRTIEYLFTTTLTNAEIILGKLSARVISILYIVLAGVPVMALAMLLGGISPQSVFLLWIITFSTAIFIAIVSLSVSVFAKRTRDAIVRAYLIMIVLLWIVPWVRNTAIADVPVIHPAIEFLTQINPWMAYYALIGASGGPAAIDAWKATAYMVVDQVLVAGTLLVYSMVMLRSVHLRERGVVARKRYRLPWSDRPIGDNPMIWKEMWKEPAARFGWIGVFAMAIIYAVVIYASWLVVPLNTLNASNLLATSNEISATVSIIALLLIGARAACGVVSEIERDCWATLISTSLTEGEIIRAKIIGNAWAVRYVAPLLLLTWLPSIIVNPLALLPMLIQFGTVILLAAFVASLGILKSLGAKSTVRAMLATIGILVFFGAGYLVVTCLCGGFALFFTPMWPLIFSACIPYLLSAPTVLSFPELYKWSSPSADDFLYLEIFIMASYLVGMGGYCYGIVFNYRLAIGRFDRLCGRTRPKSNMPGPIIAEVVFERCTSEIDRPNPPPAAL